METLHGDGTLETLFACGREQRARKLLLASGPRAMNVRPRPDRPVVFFLGENGSGKSTLLGAIARQCGIHIWNRPGRHLARNNSFVVSTHSTILLAFPRAQIYGSDGPRAEKVAHEDRTHHFICQQLFADRTVSSGGTVERR